MSELRATHICDRPIVVRSSLQRRANLRRVLGLRSATVVVVPDGESLEYTRPGAPLSGVPVNEATRTRVVEIGRWSWI